MPHMKSNRRGTSIRLDAENDAWLDAEAQRTGKSRSDIVNKAVRDASEWHQRVESCYEAQKDLINMCIDEVRNIHVDRKKEHDNQSEQLEEIKNLIKNHNDITKS